MCLDGCEQQSSDAAYTRVMVLLHAGIVPITSEATNYAEKGTWQFPGEGGEGGNGGTRI